MPEKKRRIPRQTRSSVTVDAIFEAASQIMERDGDEAFTTTRVAERAGVSVGTLYQYFGDKDDIIAAVARKRTEVVREVALTSLSCKPASGSARPIVSALLRAFKGKREARVALVDALTRDNDRRALAERQRAFMNAVGNKIDPLQTLPSAARFLLTRLAVGMVCMAALDDSVELSPASLEDELVFLIENYALALRTRALKNERPDDPTDPHGGAAGST